MKKKVFSASTQHSSMETAVVGRKSYVSLVMMNFSGMCHSILRTPTPSWCFRSGSAFSVKRQAPFRFEIGINILCEQAGTTGAFKSGGQHSLQQGRDCPRVKALLLLSCFALKRRIGTGWENVSKRYLDQPKSTDQTSDSTQSESIQMHPRAAKSDSYFIDYI